MDDDLGPVLSAPNRLVHLDRDREVDVVERVRDAVQGALGGEKLWNVVHRVDESRAHPARQAADHEPGDACGVGRLRVEDVDGFAEQPPAQAPRPPQVPFVAHIETPRRDTKCFEVADEGVLPGQQVVRLVAEVLTVTDRRGGEHQMLGAAGAQALDQPEHPDRPRVRLVGGTRTVGHQYPATSVWGKRARVSRIVAI